MPCFSRRRFPSLGGPVRGQLMQWFVKRTILSAAIGGALILLAGVGTARADDYSKCQDKLSKAQSKVYQEISRHGQFSNQAQKARNKVDDARNWCSDHGVYSTQ